MIQNHKIFTILFLGYLTVACTKAGTSPYSDLKGIAKLSPGAVVGICWRPRGSNPFASNDVNYNCTLSSTAVAYPGDKSIGTLSCSNILSSLSPILKGKKRLSETIKTIQASKDPKEEQNGISLGPQKDCDNSEFFTNYIATDSKGKHWLFIDLQLD